ncbi:MAG: class II D-tagatose-bisphosphate aldolase, non-catalytic subunit, partial [Terriglobus roseus]|nr:class II D-tagatose-bisphosphate aldolase, non-catalytic subunit [Terriglobus roseus]
MAISLRQVLQQRGAGVTSVCSAHPWVIRAAFEQGVEDESLLLLEATCNQVNQDGGYTGMQPADFRHMVEQIGAECAFPRSRLVLGGDHLGPNPWKHLPAAQAMDKAEEMVRAYVAAGFTKIHLDASMSCADDPAVLSVQDIAERAARLASAAELAAQDSAAPEYVVGTEVPTPGGAT